MRIASKIRKIRELKGFSQEYMATQLGISQVAYSKFEKDDKYVNFEKLRNISKILEIDPLKLITFDESHVFNNTNQQGGNAASVMLQNCSENERKLYEEQISHLKKEVEFLRGIIKEQE
ncbi:MAG: helix-turn-helix domain-containing protein [Bacteroidales bacterium]|nr:helix-turn-helix domain-containing protein [Bacteroidales bacterium]